MKQTFENRTARVSSRLEAETERLRIKLELMSKMIALFSQELIQREDRTRKMRENMETARRASVEARMAFQNIMKELMK